MKARKKLACKAHKKIKARIARKKRKTRKARKKNEGA